jgi:hypothetical protein
MILSASSALSMAILNTPFLLFRLRSLKKPGVKITRVIQSMVGDAVYGKIVDKMFCANIVKKSVTTLTGSFIDTACRQVALRNLSCLSRLGDDLSSSNFQFCFSKDLVG